MPDDVASNRLNPYGFRWRCRNRHLENLARECKNNLLPVRIALTQLPPPPITGFTRDPALHRSVGVAVVTRPSNCRGKSSAVSPMAMATPSVTLADMLVPD